MNLLKNTNCNPGYVIARQIAFGEILRKNREDKGYTIEALSEISGLSCDLIERVEAGKFAVRSNVVFILGHYLGFELNTEKIK